MPDPARPHPPSASLNRLLILAVVAVVAGAIFLRFYALDRLPGVNGDEAWYGVKVQSWAAGTLTDWRTPTGNLPGPLQMGSLALLQSLFAPSFWLLRLPTVVSSLAAMALAFVTARRFFGTTAGVAALLMMAALPANVVYARFGWDPSHSGLVILIATFLALDRRFAWSALAFAFALWVHPTNVFAAPFLVLAFAGAEFEDGARDRALLRVGLFVGLLLAALAILTVTAHQLASGSAVAGAVGGGGAVASVAAVAEAKGWLLFPGMFVQFLSGETVLSYLTGTGWRAAQPIANAIVATALVGLLGAGIARLWPDRVTRSAGVVAGFIASLGAFFLIAGAPALHAGEDRYALCLIDPTVMALAVLVAALVRTRRQQTLGLGLMALVALGALGGVWLRYIDPIASGRGGAHRAFWTGPVEPKQAALAMIAADAHGQRARIVAEDWWAYWPLAYLANGRFDVVQLDDPRGASVNPGDAGYYVGWRGGALDAAMARAHPAARWAVPALNPAEQLIVWKITSPGGSR